MPLTPENKNSATLTGFTKTGAGWLYDQTDIAYDGPTDSEGRTVYYEAVGVASTLTPESKNSATLTGESKNSV